MGLFDFLLSEEKKIQKHARRLTNRDAQPEDREGSARWLAENGSNRAMMALLTRFDMNLDHQLKDAGEKEFIYALVAGLGEKAIEPVRAWLRQCRQFALPLRLYQDLAGRDHAVEIALELLDQEAKREEFRADKKKGLLVWLAEVRDPRLVEAIAPFLSDFDEGVRYAAAEVILAQGGEDARKALSKALVNPEEESNRLRVRIAEVFDQRGWKVEGAEGLEEHLPSGFVVRDGRVYRTG